MAARKTGSGANGLLLYNEPDWRERVMLLDRDCSHLEDPEQSFLSKLVTYISNGTKEQDPKNTVETRTLNDIFGGSVRTANWDPNLGCSISTKTQSLVGLNVHAGYNNPNNNVRSIRMPGQPFAFAGDTTLTPIRDGQGNHFVAIDRLYGNENNEFTVVNVQKKFPAAPPADTPALIEENIKVCVQAARISDNTASGCLGARFRFAGPIRPNVVGGAG
ncbi:MAG: hypothetical protein EB075_15425 [Bacteroidetes bacterium]|nr:hypothetical protein [Bacteroidota bacterium]